MGLVFHPTNAADALEWGQHRSQKILLMATNGPSASNKKCCQCPRMGPVSQPKNTTDGHEWAQCSYDELLPIPLDGPIVIAENNTDGHEWA